MVSPTSSVGIDIGNMSECVQDVANAPALSDPALGVDIQDYYALLGALKSSDVQRDTFPGVYLNGAVLPFINYVESLGRRNYEYLMQTPFNQLRNRTERFLAQILPDVAHAILQNAYQYRDHSSDAFQEMVSDLYDGYVSDADRAGIKRPDKGILPPLVKWGSHANGPYTWTISATSQIGLAVPIVSLPPSYSSQGLLAWATLAHETGGHDVMHADTGLEEELGQAVYDAIYNKYGSRPFARYWQGCIGEAGADVLGLLNMGPAAGIGLIGYFRGVRQNNRLSTSGSFHGPHPVDALRGILAAQVISKLTFTGSEEWSKKIEDETMRDLGSRNFTLYDDTANRSYTLSQAPGIESAKIVASVIMDAKLNSLEGHSLKEIQDWTDMDQVLSELIGDGLSGDEDVSDTFNRQGLYATHVVSGAVLAALESNADVGKIFQRMKDHLAVMHQHNTTWSGYTTSHTTPVAMHTPHAEVVTANADTENIVLV